MAITSQSGQLTVGSVPLRPAGRGALGDAPVDLFAVALVTLGWLVLSAMMAAAHHLDWVAVMQLGP